MNPIRVTPPASPVVALAALKEHLRVVGEHDDAHITALEQAAVAHLDGWRGVLGRCILPQQWQVAYTGAGVWRLPFPDVTEVSAVDGDGNAVEATLSQDAISSIVTLETAAVVTLTAALPEDALEAVRLAIMVWVQAHYDGLDVPNAFFALIEPIRVIRL